MKAVTCKESRCAIEEAALEQQLSLEVLSHLRVCAECETFFGERTRLRQLVASLGTVAAPPDFDFRLRARLADVKTERAPISGRLFVAAPALALIVVILFLGVLYGWRMTPETEKEKPSIAGTPAVDQVKEPGTSPTPALVAIPENLVDEGINPEAIPKQRQPVKHSQNATTGRRPRTEARDFSNTLAPMVKQEEAIAGINKVVELPISANYQSLTVSLDDGSGKPRTISLPRVSFGSERVLPSGFAPATKPNSGIW